MLPLQDNLISCAIAYASLIQVKKGLYGSQNYAVFRSIPQVSRSLQGLRQA